MKTPPESLPPRRFSGSGGTYFYRREATGAFTVYRLLLGQTQPASAPSAYTTERGAARRAHALAHPTPRTGRPSKADVLARRRLT